MSLNFKNLSPSFKRAVLMGLVSTSLASCFKEKCEVSYQDIKNGEILTIEMSEGAAQLIINNIKEGKPDTLTRVIYDEYNNIYNEDLEDLKNGKIKPSDTKVLEDLGDEFFDVHRVYKKTGIKKYVPISVDVPEKKKGG